MHYSLYQKKKLKQGTLLTVTSSSDFFFSPTEHAERPSENQMLYAVPSHCNHTLTVFMGVHFNFSFVFFCFSHQTSQDQTLPDCSQFYKFNHMVMRTKKVWHFHGTFRCVFIFLFFFLSFLFLEMLYSFLKIALYPNFII